MKKLKLFLLTILAVVLGTLGFVACGDNGGVEGTYNFSYISTTTSDGEPLLVYAGEKYEGVVVPEDLIEIKLQSGGKLTIKLIENFETSEKITFKGSWEKGEGDILVFIIDNSPQEVTLKNGYLEFDFSGMGLLVLEKD